MISTRITLMGQQSGPAEFSASNTYIDSMTGGVWWNGTTVNVEVELVDSNGVSMTYNPGGNWTTFIDGGITHTGTLSWDNSKKKYTGTLTMTDTTWGDISSARYLRVYRDGVEVGRERYYYYTDHPAHWVSTLSTQNTTPLPANALYTFYYTLKDRFGQELKTDTNVVNRFTFSYENCTEFSRTYDVQNSRWEITFKVSSLPNNNAKITITQDNGAVKTYTALVNVPLQAQGVDTFNIEALHGTHTLDTSNRIAGLDWCVVVYAQGTNGTTLIAPYGGWDYKGGNSGANRHLGVATKQYTGSAITFQGQQPGDYNNINGGTSAIVYWFRGGTNRTATVQETFGWWAGNKASRTANNVQTNKYYIDAIATSNTNSGRQIQFNTVATARHNTARDCSIAGSDWSSGYQNTGVSDRQINFEGSAGNNESQAAITFYIG